MSRAVLLFPTLLVATVATVAAVAACGGSGATKVSSGAGPMFGAAPVDEPPVAREQDATQQVNHVLSRLTFGAMPGDVTKVREMGVDRWIDMQLHPERIDDAATERYLTDPLGRRARRKVSAGQSGARTARRGQRRPLHPIAR